MVPPLSAGGIPAEVETLKDELTEMLPFAPIALLLIELDARTGFLECFAHVGGASWPRPPRPKATSSPC